MAAHISEQAAILIDKYQFHLVELPHGSKKPVRGKWETDTIHTAERARQVWKGEDGERQNIGVVLGPSCLASLDIDDAEAAEIIFAEFGIDIAEYRLHSPVIQGTPGCFRIMFRVPEGIEIEKHIVRWPNKDDKSKKHVVLELRSGASQDVLPPSMHPDGFPYLWLTKPNGSIPELPDDLMAWWKSWDIFKVQAEALCPWADPVEVRETLPRNYGPKAKTGDSVIEEWNKCHPLRTMLVSHGYVLKGKRYLSPHSTTKLPGVKMFDEDSCWNHHGSDPLCSTDKGQPRDSFDFFVEYSHNGNFFNATKDAAKLLGMDYKTRSTVFHDSKPIPAIPANDDVPEEYGSPTHLYHQMGLRLDQNEKPVLNVDNIMRVLCHHPDIKSRLWYDEFLERTMTTWGRPEGSDAIEWSDRMDILLLAHLQRDLSMNKLAKQTVIDAVQGVAELTKRNECRDWLESLVWDGVERLPGFLHNAFGTPDDAYHQAVGRCWFVSIAARVLIPGSKVDTMPVFEGKQGLRKSSALRAIGGKWFTECHENILDKDFYGVLQGKMIVEIAEMHAFSKADVNRIKGIISNQVDRYRESYGRRSADHPRQSVFAGTTNSDDWNRDETGARRFWPVSCTAIDLQYIHDNRTQLFAEAVARKVGGEAWWDVPEEDAKRHQDDRRPEDSWESAITEHLKYESIANVDEILRVALHIETGRQTPSDQSRCAKVLSALGWERKKVMGENKKQKRAWVRVSASL